MEGDSTATLDDLRQRIEQMQDFVARKQRDHDAAVAKMNERRAALQSAILKIREFEDDALANPARRQIGNDQELIGVIRRLNNLGLDEVQSVESVINARRELDQAEHLRDNATAAYDLAKRAI